MRAQHKDLLKFFLKPLKVSALYLNKQSWKERPGNMLVAICIKLEVKVQYANQPAFSFGKFQFSTSLNPDGFKKIN
jgi:hypothetical protein